MAIAKYFGLIPAAGYGERFGGTTPKQYVSLAGEPLLAHSLRCLVEGTPLVKTFVVLARNDRLFTEKINPHPRINPLYCGATTRGESVLQGLELMRGEAHERDWVLVHDAVRPCLPKAVLLRLLTECSEDKVGGLLAMPVVDTLKRGDEKRRVTITLQREQVWQAQTPQMFRYGMLLEALRQTSGASDEAQAIEYLNLQPKLIMGSPLNIKVTYPEDLALAESILRREEQ